MGMKQRHYRLVEHGILAGGRTLDTWKARIVMAYKVRLKDTFNRRNVKDKVHNPTKDTLYSWKKYRPDSSIASNANGYIRKYRFSESKGHWLTDGWKIPLT